MIAKSTISQKTTHTVVDVSTGLTKTDAQVVHSSSVQKPDQLANKNIEKLNPTIIDPNIIKSLKSAPEKRKIPVRTQAQEDMLKKLSLKAGQQQIHVEKHRVSVPPVKTVINLSPKPTAKETQAIPQKIVEVPTPPVETIQTKSQTKVFPLEQVLPKKIAVKDLPVQQNHTKVHTKPQQFASIPELSSNSKLYVSSKPKPTKTNVSIKSNKSFNFVKQVFTKLVVASLAIVAGVSLGFAGDKLNLISSADFTQNSNSGNVAGVVESKPQDTLLTPEYVQWSQEVFKQDSDPKEDRDGDGLTNYEEFLLGSNPSSIHSCNPDSTDAQNLFNLVDPVTCKEIDFEDNNALDKFNQVINTSVLREQFTQAMEAQPITQTPAESPVSQDSVLNLFGVKNYQELDKITTQSLTTEAQKKQTKIDYLKQIQKIEQYMNKFRSYEVYDRDYGLPVHPAKFLEVSIKYNTPLKYVIAIARTESRFGTDRFDRDGNLTRPGKYQNIYSIGLTDSGNNFAYPTWESGVEGFGKWYKKFNDRGVSDCRKWRIYNPNGDYCSKIESLASEVEYFIYSK